MIDMPEIRLRSVRVFVADDDPEQGDLVRAILVRHGYETTSVRGGRDALRVLETKASAGLLVLAQEMSEYAGSDILAEMERHATWYRVPAILMTQHPGSLLASLLASAGQAVIGKPVVASELLAHVRRLLPPRAASVSRAR